MHNLFMLVLLTLLPIDCYCWCVGV